MELRLEEIPRAIEGAGFVPAEMRIRARGRYVVTGEEASFLIRGWRKAIEVEAAGPFPEGDTLLRAAVDTSGGGLSLEPLRGARQD